MKAISQIINTHTVTKEIVRQNYYKFKSQIKYLFEFKPITKLYSTTLVYNYRLLYCCNNAVLYFFLFEPEFKVYII